LTANDFPFHSGTSDTNDIASSMGVFHAQFTAIGFPADSGTTSLSFPGSVFNVDDRAGHTVLVKNVEPRNTPTVINAIFSHRNFWDGRARAEFNGVDPFGGLDPAAQVIKAVPTCAACPTKKVVLTQISVGRMSTGSQADGPPLSDLEMSFAGRRFPELGRKMLNPSFTALRQQLVSITDSVFGVTGPLGLLSKFPNPGLTAKYANLITQAFSATWWNAPD
jgi:Di-haem cytochrome c peroxidase